MFITLEGSEGAGKSTSLEFMTHWFKAKGIEPVLTREPGGTPIAEEIREILLKNRNEKMHPDTELLLMYAGRVQNLKSLILPNLKDGKVVISDRFNDASFAYQGAGRGLAIKRITKLDQWCLGDIKPDLTLFLDISVELGLKRANSRSDPDRFEKESIDFFKKIRQGYLLRAKNEPERIKVIDASGTIAQVQESIATVLGEAFSE